MNKNKARFIAIPFIVLTFSIFFVNIVNADKESSISENRALQQKPTIDDLEDKTYTTKYDSYYSDQFAFREELSNIYTKLEHALGKDKVKGYYLLDNNWIMPTPVEEFKEKDVKILADYINKLSNGAVERGKEVYYVNTPHKESALRNLYKKNTKGVGNAQKNKDKLKNYINEKDVKFIDLDEYFLDEFEGHQIEKLYYKTDHHWNGFGAFLGFEKTIEEMGIVDNLNRDNYIMSSVDEGYFLGSYNKNLNKLVNEDESISYVHSKEKGPYKYFKYDGKNEKEVDEKEVIATRIKEDDILYGGAYMFGNACSTLKIKNEEALSDKKIIIFRDSYQAPTSWLFADIFKEVELVDPRYVETIGMSCSEILENSEADIAMFMYDTVDFKEMIEEMKKN